MMLRKTVVALTLLVLAEPVLGADWPMSGFAAGRGGASPQELPVKLYLQWTRDLPTLTPAWPDQGKMQFDAAYDPIVVGKTMYMASSRWDCLTALDTATGVEKWRFFAEAPIRFAPVAWEDRLYFAADDGYLYCLGGARGNLLWKFRGGPGDRKILGNDRLISTWPARGAPVIADGNVYFAASIWPFMGIFIHALDARSGTPLWSNDGDGSTYMKQPHNTDSFAGVAPQGPLVAMGDRLLLPGGRSVPASYDRKTGKVLRYVLAENGKRGGGSDVVASDNYFFNGGAAFDLATEKYLGEIGKPVVVSGNVLFAFSGGACRAYDLQAGPKIVDKKNKSDDKKPEDKKLEEKAKDDKPLSPNLAKITAAKVVRFAAAELAACKTPAAECLIKAGSRLYGGTAGQIFAVDLPAAGNQMSISWTREVDGTVVRLVAADDRLFAVTREGRLYCFGIAPTEAVKQVSPTARQTPEDEWSKKAHHLLETTKVRDGYCIVWGVGNGRLVTELARQSKMHVIGIDPDEKKINALRGQLHAEDLYGHRVALVTGDARIELPPYLATLMVADDLPGAGFALDDSFLKAAFNSLRPFGGVFCLNADAKNLAQLASKGQLAGAEVRVTNNVTQLFRQGALPGSANWTHEHADASNTRVSRDQIVKAPLGVLWFGGPSNDSILPRHGHGPQPQVIDGRLIIEGVDLMRAIDIYTGRLLWETPMPGLGQFFNNTAHQPGANSSGSNFVSMADGIYVAYRDTCVILDPATGKKLSTFKLPSFPGQKNSMWGYINVAGDFLVGGADPLLDPKLLPPKELPPGAGDDDAEKKDNLLSKVVKTLKSFSDNLSSSKHLVVMDRHTGKVLWTATAQAGFRHNGTCVGGGKLFTIDRLSGVQVAKLKKDLAEPVPARLIAFDLKSGKQVWSAQTEVFGTWVSYSAQHNIVLEAGRVARDSLSDEPKGMRAYQALTGEVLWYNKAYAGPAMIHNDTILQDQGGCDIRTGDLKMRPDPLTGQLVPWRWIRNYGCNTPMASEHLLTFRSGAAGYFDYCNDGGTGNFGGFRSSCTNNLMVAGGILTAPEYTRTCTCAYQNQCSIALIHMPQAEMWTSFGSKEIKGTIQRVGVNLGAAGDRKAENGTLWLEYPSVAGTSPPISVSTKPASPHYFRRYASLVDGPMNWVTSSGAKGLSEITVSLGKEATPRPCTVRLFFAEPDRLGAGKRQFSIHLQGKEAIRDLDVAREAGGDGRTLVKEFPGILVSDTLTIRLTPRTNATAETLLCGIEIVAEKTK